MQDKMDAGWEGVAACRTGEMEERRDAGKKGATQKRMVT